MEAGADQAREQATGHQEGELVQVRNSKSIKWLNGVEMANHLGADAHSVGGRDARVGIYGVAGVVRRNGHEGHAVLHQHCGLDGAVSESVEREIRRIQTGSHEATFEEGVELVLLQRDPGFARLRRDAENRGVGAACVVAVNACQGVEGTDRAPVWVRRGREGDSLDSLLILDGLGLPDREDDAVLHAGDVSPGEDLKEIDLFAGKREEVARPQH